jgi:hypothetical protein
VSPGLLLMALVLFMVQTSSMTPAPVLPLFVPHLQGVPVVHGVARQDASCYGGTLPNQPAPAVPRRQVYVVQ